ncbi:AbrB/MazE/SpoVT family DNA-binding domain-containing protein [Anaeromusa acidaminophila]|uniref:AbrB/MazE/SpoVT family DNA-binding domain-containing protein n=1 Tax=Anaeromusa acidaminophila TaxID=81464 RepID=UPI000368B30B|nr:AbrB/MazE/SpoVT family DNA-binding domain-containing protein [Anaeromusa acidaminophila]
MSKAFISLGKKGTLTLPISFRRKCGLIDKDAVAIDITDKNEIIIIPSQDLENLSSHTKRREVAISALEATSGLWYKNAQEVI